MKSQNNRIFIKKPFKENRAEKANKNLLKMKLDHALIKTRTRCTVLCVQVDGSTCLGCTGQWEHLPRLHKAWGSSIGTAKNKIHKTEPSEAG